MKNVEAWIRDRLSVDYVKSQIMETTYGNRSTFIAALDPRVVVVWYLLFAILPWLFFNKTTLIGLALLTAAVAALARLTIC